MNKDITAFIDSETSSTAKIECAGCERIIDAYEDSEDEAIEQVAKSCKDWKFAASTEYQCCGFVCPKCFAGEGEIKDWKAE